MLGFLARRTLLALLATYLVVSVAFGVVAFTPDPNLQGQLWQLQRHGATDAELAEFKENYLEVRNRDRPLVDRYVTWLARVATLDLGYSVTYGEPVHSVLAKKLPYTLGYVVPGMALSLVAGAATGVLTALRAGSRRDRWTRYVAYHLLGVPNWWVAVTIIGLWGTQLGYYQQGVVVQEPNPMQLGDLHRFLIPAVVLATSLFAVQLRYARVEALDYLGNNYTRLLRAKGAARRDVAAHVVRNTTVPLLSVFFAELVAVLVVNVYVMEAAFRIPGIGEMTLTGIRERDINLVMAATLLLVVAAIVGNLLQDVAYYALDPRAGDE